MEQQGDHVYICVFGGEVDAEGVCIEHGETACVVSVPAPDEDD